MLKKLAAVLLFAVSTIAHGHAQWSSGVQENELQFGNGFYNVFGTVGPFPVPTNYLVCIGQIRVFNGLDPVEIIVYRNGATEVFNSTIWGTHYANPFAGGGFVNILFMDWVSGTAKYDVYIRTLNGVAYMKHRFFYCTI